MQNDRGFSLLEVLVGLFILAMIGAAGTTVLMRAVDSRDRLQEATDRAAQISGVHARMRDDLAQWVPRPAVSRPGLDMPSQFLGGGVNDSALLFAFVRDGWTNPGLVADRSGLLGVRYEVYNQQLTRKVMLRPDGTNSTDVLEDVLLDEVEDAQVDFWQGSQWVPRWQSSEAGLNGAPDAVRLRFALKNKQTIEWLFLTPAGDAR